MVVGRWGWLGWRWVGVDGWGGVVVATRYSITHTGSDHELSKQSIYESISYHDLISGRGGGGEEEEGKGVMFNSGQARHTITPLTSYDSWSAHLPTDPWPNMKAP